ncbi:acyl-CoA dehydrogenase family protein [Microbacterium memoriense]|uniref:Acyl-CoA dehydrogenase n=1 Tax=Microbacterium memoriense TaxID=2978350 RepID=A0ABT2PAY1_9MICO|nr:acyl-CoA dehydrogenase [Microbacterium memoriense]MCT9001730.1 acyl-CoA dehydrogenase [Microbacterium memoriense]
MNLETAAQPLSLRPGPAGAAATSVAQLAAGVPLLGAHLAATVEWAVAAAAETPAPGEGRTRETWEVLASAAAADVAGARILEPHLDARSILREASDAGIPVDLDAIGDRSDGSWGVYAAEGARLEARPARDGWRLDGTKDWCSLAGTLSHALVTAWTGPETRRLFAVALRQPGVNARRGPWVSRGLSQVVSAPVDFDDASAVPVGEDGWYLSRPGFAWGGMGVAAVWWGSTAPLVRAVIGRAQTSTSDQVAEVFAGAADAAFWSVRAVLAEAADAVDAGVTGRDLKITAERVRAITSSQVESILSITDRALGPAPLATDEQHARRVADLRIYLRQHHGERDLARLGRLLAS